MSCKHEFDNLPFHDEKHCRNCGKSEAVIRLEAQVEALQAQNAALTQRLAAAEAVCEAYTRNKRLCGSGKFPCDWCDHEVCHAWQDWRKAKEAE